MSWREEFRIWSCRAACFQLARVGGFRGKGEKLQRKGELGSLFTEVVEVH